MKQINHALVLIIKCYLFHANERANEPNRMFFSVVFSTYHLFTLNNRLFLSSSFGLSAFPTFQLSSQWRDSFTIILSLNFSILLLTFLCFFFYIMFLSDYFCFYQSASNVYTTQILISDYILLWLDHKFFIFVLIFAEDVSQKFGVLWSVYEIYNLFNKHSAWLICPFVYMIQI